MRRLLPALLALVTAVALASAAPAQAATPRSHGRVAGTVVSRTSGAASTISPHWRTGSESLTIGSTGHALPALRLPGAHGNAGKATSAATADVTLGRTAGSASSALTPSIASAPAGAEQVLTSFSDFSPSFVGPIYPPDDAVASNGTQVLHLVNGGVVATTVAGDVLGVDSLDDFFGVDVGYATSDPQAVFDSASGRWVFTVLEYNQTTIYDSRVLLLTSTGPDVLSSTLHRFEAASSGSTLLDQPRLGITSDKILISTGDFDGGGFLGPDEWVLNKAEAYAASSGALLDTTVRFSFPSDFGIAPATNVSTGSTGYFVTTGPAPSNQLRVVAVTGVPTPTSSAAYHAVDQSIGLATGAPAASSVPGGASIDNGDERMQALSWFNGSLLAVASQPCTPFDDGTVRACIRFWRVATATMTLIEDKVVGVAGVNFSSPAGIQDRLGGLHFAATASSPDFSPSLVAFARPAGAGWDSDLTYVALPSNDYVGVGGGTQRWGDYTGMAVDPLRPADVWVAGEHVDPTSSVGPNWMTTFAQVSSSPHLVAIARSATTVLPSGAVTLTGTLTRPGGQPVAGATLSLWRKPHTSLVWALATTGVTTAAGKVTFVDHPTVNEDYQWRFDGAILAGFDPSVLAQYTVPAVSAVGTVLVAPKVTIASNKTSMVRGSTVTFSGTVTPNHSGKRVYLQRYLGSGRWANVTYKALTTSSAYAFAVKITTPGTFTYRVWFVADTDHTNAYSAAKAIKVT
jgi:hypothetical protein